MSFPRLYNRATPHCAAPVHPVRRQLVVIAMCLRTLVRSGPWRRVC